MGTIFRPVTTKPLPAGAEITERDGQRTARWRNGNSGKLCSAPVRTTPRGDCVAIEGGKYLARYRDGDGIVQTVATGCRDEDTARAVLSRLERRAELVHAGVLSVAEDAVADHKRSMITGHVETYVSALRARGCTEKHVKGVRRRLLEIVTACRLRALRDLRRETVEAWLGNPENRRRSARTRNTFVAALKAFSTWAVDNGRLTASPVARIALADEKADRRRQPRALTEDEVVRLLDAARRRPLAQAALCNRGWRKNQPGARLRPETRDKLQRLGMERALSYRVMLWTGIRLGELAAIRNCDVALNAPQPFIDLAASHEKNREGSHLPLRADLADELRAWIATNPGPKLFRLSHNAVKVLNRDLAFAGIAKRDDRGRTLCVHSMRYTFATMLSRSGVAPRVAMAAMRHSSMALTMETYTDPRLLDVAGAMSLLPELPLDSFSSRAREGDDNRKAVS